MKHIKNAFKKFMKGIKDFRKADKSLLFVVTVYCVFGLIMIFSASTVSTILRWNYSSAHFFWNQLIVLVISFLLGVILIVVPMRKYKFLSYLSVFVVGLLLFYVLLYGHVSGNAKSWFIIWKFRFQPAEFAKSVMIIAMGFYYNNLASNRRIPFSWHLVPLIIAFIMAFFIWQQPDKGGTIIFLAIVFMTFLSVPKVMYNIWQSLRYIIVGLIIIVCVLVLAAPKLLEGEAYNRLTSFLHPCEKYYEDEGSGYQVCNGFIAISNGGLTGVKIGNSSQKYMYLPESHTDFIFPIICEECGLLCGIAVILGYGFILYRINKIAREADNVRNRTIAYGAFWYFLIHIFINLFGVLALIPLTGITLPFLSYGGSFTFNALLLIFLVIRISIENKDAKFKKEMAKL